MRALLTLVVTADPAEREAVVQELKAGQRGAIERHYGLRGRATVHPRWCAGAN